MLDRDVAGVDEPRRVEVAGVGGDDQVRVGRDRRGEHVPVLRCVVHRRDEFVGHLDPGVGEGRLQRPDRYGVEPVRVDLWMAGQDVASHLVDDAVGPDRVVVAHSSQREHDIAQPLRVEPVGVEHGDQIIRMAHRTPRSSSASASAVNSSSRRSRRALKSRTADRGTRWRLPVFQ